MSIHSDLMRSGADVLFAVQGDAAAARYKKAGGGFFDWKGASVGMQSGGLEESEAGDLLKVIRMIVTGPTSVLLAHGVGELQREATVVAAGHEWSIEMAASHWGPEIVRLGLLRRPIARREEMESGIV